MNAEQYVKLRLREGLDETEAARQCGMGDVPTEAAEALYRRVVDRLRGHDGPGGPDRFITSDHIARLELATHDDERWDTLSGHLYDPHATDGDVCPDEMVEYVATRFVFTTRGRLFQLRKGGRIVERASSERGQFNVTRRGHRWQPTVKGLMARVYPGVLVGDYEYTDGEQGREPWMEHLRERADRAGAPVKRRAATQDEMERYERICF